MRLRASALQFLVQTSVRHGRLRERGIHVHRLERGLDERVHGVAYEHCIKLKGTGIPARKQKHVRVVHAHEDWSGESGGCIHSAIIVAGHGGPGEHVGFRLTLGVRREGDGAYGGRYLDEAQRVSRSILRGIKPLIGSEIRAVKENGDELALLVPRLRLCPDALIGTPLIDNVVDLELPPPLKEQLLAGRYLINGLRKLNNQIDR